MLNLKQNIQIAVSFDEKYVDRFLTIVNNICAFRNQRTHQIHDLKSNVNKLLIIDTLEFFICYNGSLNNLSDIQRLVKTRFPEVIFNFKHVPTECPQLEEFLLKNYPFIQARDTLQTCSLYYRMCLDTIWPDLNGLVLQIDLDLIFRRDVKSLFDLVIDMSQTTEHILYACAGRDIYCWDLKLSIMKPDELHEWTRVKGKRVLQHYVNDWFNWFMECASTVEAIDVNYYKKHCINIATENATHFNAGVLMFNITKYRENNIQQICRDCMVLHKKFNMFFHNDQGILNFVFFNNVGALPISWNLVDYGCGHNYLLNPNAKCKDEFDESNIVHFNGPYKPWCNSSIDKIPLHALELWRKYENIIL